MISQNIYKRIIESYSAVKVFDSQCSDFPTEKYSKFKYGSNTIAREFGYELAEGFINQQFRYKYNGEPLVVLPSAYSHIPTASYYLTLHFVDKLNQYLYQDGYPPVEIGKISRNVTYREDYGEMNAEQRFNLIKNDKFHIDIELLKGKLLIFIDDIKITGTHERIIVNMLDEFDVQNHCYMLYYAELLNKSIHPNIENYLNNKSVKNIFDLNSIVKQDNFKFNTRIVKYILNNSPDDCKEFLIDQSDSFIEQLYFNALGNEYYKFPEYLINLQEVEKIFFHKHEYHNPNTNL